MKAAIVSAPGSAPEYGDFAEPEVERGAVLVHVSAAALSHVTRSRASGSHYSSEGRYPFVPGLDGTGRLEDGRRVYFVMPEAPYGSMAERTAVARDRCVPLPDDLDDATAAAIANPGMSSWAALMERARLKRGETVLVNGATGAAGSLAVKIARHLGAGKVIATGRNRAVLESLGADIAIPLTDDPDALEATFREHFAAGIDIVLDYLWGVSAERLLIAAARASAEAVPVRYVQIGSASGEEVTLPSAVLRSSAIVLMGSGIGSVPPPRLLDAIAGVLKAAVPAGLSIATTTVPLADVAKAWGSADAEGRIVFTIPQPAELAVARKQSLLARLWS